MSPAKPMVREALRAVPAGSTVSYTGLVNSDTPATFSSLPYTPPSIATTATAASHVAGSPYTITASGAVDSDYSIGYAAGTLAWEARRESRRAKGAPRVMVTPGGVGLAWALD